MREELQQRLFDSFPELFSRRTLPMSKTCMCWGICCGDGWYSLLHNCAARLSAISKQSGLRVFAEQVKEKFGTLRFHYDIEYPEGVIRRRTIWRVLWDLVVLLRLSRVSLVCDFMRHREWYGLATRGRFGLYRFDRKLNAAVKAAEDAITLAETQSAFTCGTCGQPGKTHSVRGWLDTVCPECHRKWKESRGITE